MSHVFVCQAKYRQAAKEQSASSLYSKLPETLETKHAKEASELQSEVRQLSLLFFFIFHPKLYVTSAKLHLQ